MSQGSILLYLFICWILVYTYVLFVAGANIDYTGEPVSCVALMENPFLIENNDVCKNLENLTFIVLVNSAISHFDRRENMRDTWTNQKVLREHVVRRVFLLGRPDDIRVQALIENEQDTYRDIVQGDFIDSYRNLTHKAILGLRWVTRNCQNAKFVVKVDDDVFINTLLLLSHFEKEYTGKTRHVWCPLRGSSKINRQGKWKVESHMFQNMTHYPFPDCMGYTVVMTNDIIPALSMAAKTTPFFWIDDLFVYGMLVNRVGRIVHKRLKPITTSEPSSLECYRKGEKPCDWLVGRAVSAGAMDEMWIHSILYHKDLSRRYLRDTLFSNYSEAADIQMTQW